ncbi:hypothetical protein, partial [Arthrobacter rhombi]|uniref:hypothetical protein n=1 Tax=Arthrobacter rhombi TaxID=71253 RepID=UPI003FCF2E30
IITTAETTLTMVITAAETTLTMVITAAVTAFTPIVGVLVSAETTFTAWAVVAAGPLGLVVPRASEILAFVSHGGRSSLRSGHAASGFLLGPLGSDQGEKFVDSILDESSMSSPTMRNSRLPESGIGS